MSSSNTAMSFDDDDKKSEASATSAAIWACPTCTFHNEIGDWKCVMCTQILKEELEESLEDFDALTRFPFKSEKEIQAGYYNHFLKIASENSNGRMMLDPDSISIIVQFCEPTRFIGCRLDCQDNQGRWYIAEIIRMKQGAVKVHFIGWHKKWDLWIKLSENDRLADLYTHTTPKIDKDDDAQSDNDSDGTGWLSGDDEVFGFNLHHLIECVGYEELESTLALLQYNGNLKAAQYHLHEIHKPERDLETLKNFGYTESDCAGALALCQGNLRNAHLHLIQTIRPNILNTTRRPVPPRTNPFDYSDSDSSSSDSSVKNVFGGDSSDDSSSDSDDDNTAVRLFGKSTNDPPSDSSSESAADVQLFGGDSDSEDSSYDGDSESDVPPRIFGDDSESDDEESSDA